MFNAEKLIRSALGLAIIAGAIYLGWSIGPKPDAAAPEEAALDLDAPVGGPFTLVGVDGRPVSDTEFRGRYMLIVFGYTFCPDVCPTSLLAVGRALDELDATRPELSQEIVPLFVTLDPERDTPEQMGRYLGNFDSRIVGLSGDPGAIERMATAYGVRFEKVEDESVSGYLLDHTTNIMFMGPDGAYLTHFSPLTPPPMLAQAIARYMGAGA